MLKKLCTIVVSLVLCIILALIIAYMAILGFTDEDHTLGNSDTCSASAVTYNNSTSTSNDNELKIMTYNLFLINCGPGVKCQEKELRQMRVTEITDWFTNENNNNKDVVLFQEVFSYHDQLIEGMTNAGYCYYTTTKEKSGSGLAVFSKYPIIEQDFKGWFHAFGVGEGSLTPDLFNPEVYLANKGVLYVKIEKPVDSGNDNADKEYIHLFNLHTNSDSIGDNHETRKLQFGLTKDFVESKEIPSDELVLIGGDFNEDYRCRKGNCYDTAKCESHSYYYSMLEILDAGEMLNQTLGTYTYNTEENALLKSLYEGSDCEFYQYTLDHLVYSQSHLMPVSYFCEVMNPLSEEGDNLSDHLPIACNITY